MMQETGNPYNPPHPNPLRKRSRFIQTIKAFRYHWIDTLLTVAFWVAGIIFNYAVEPFHRYFNERDPALSYPRISKSGVAVPDWLLFVLALLIPGVIIVISQFAIRRRFRDASRHKIADLFVAQAALFQAVGLTLFLTSGLKIFFGRQRPNFFAMCNYQGYGDAMISGDFTEYDALTQANRQGSIEFCRGSKSDIRQSMLSHPSGHASLSFAGLGYLAIFLYNLVLSHRPTRRNHMWKAIVFVVPIIAALIVAATRTRDYWHNFDDTILGSLLGFGIAGMVFHINYSRSTTTNVEYIGDLFPQNRGKQQQIIDSRNDALNAQGMPVADKEMEGGNNNIPLPANGINNV